MDPKIEPTPNVARPIEVTRAVQLISASFAIGGIRSVFDLAQKISGVYFLLALLALGVFLGICFFFVSKISAGRNWARFTLLVLLLLQLPFAILNCMAELRKSIPSGSLSILVVILQLIGAYLLLTKSSNLWFRARK